MNNLANIGPAVQLVPLKIWMFFNHTRIKNLKKKIYKTLSNIFWKINKKKLAEDKKFGYQINEEIFS